MAGGSFYIYVRDRPPPCEHAWPIGSSSEAGAWFQSGSSTSEIARSGLMIVSSVGADNSINGTLDVDFPNAGHMTSEFHAKWLPSNFYCF